MARIGSVLIVAVIVILLVFVGYNYSDIVTGKAVKENLGDCYDTDGGKDYYLRGNITKTGVNSDMCAMRPNDVVSGSNTGDLVEFYCENNKAEAAVYKCPNGCKNGACISTVNGVIFLDQKLQTVDADEFFAPCRDTDGGKFYGKKGMLSGTTIDPATAEDGCMLAGGENVLAEKYCYNQEYGAVEYYSCSIMGMGCEDGACVALGPLTESKDLAYHYTVISDDVMTNEPGCTFGGPGNYEPWAEGYINIQPGVTPTNELYRPYVGTTAKERCDPSIWNIKWEFYCDGHGYAHIVKVRCDNGCQNGRCERG